MFMRRTDKILLAAGLSGALTATGISIHDAVKRSARERVDISDHRREVEAHIKWLGQHGPLSPSEIKAIEIGRAVERMRYYSSSFVDRNVKPVIPTNAKLREQLRRRGYRGPR